MISTLVMVWGLGLVGLELRARFRGRPSVIGPVPGPPKLFERSVRG